MTFQVPRQSGRQSEDQSEKQPDFSISVQSNGFYRGIFTCASFSSLVHLPAPFSLTFLTAFPLPRPTAPLLSSFGHMDFIPSLTHRRVFLLPITPFLAVSKKRFNIYLLFFLRVCVCVCVCVCVRVFVHTCRSPWRPEEDIYFPETELTDNFGSIPSGRDLF